MIAGAVLGFLMWVAFYGKTDEEAERDTPDLYPWMPDLGLILLVGCGVALIVMAIARRRRKGSAA